MHPLLAGFEQLVPCLGQGRAPLQVAYELQDVLAVEITVARDAVGKGIGTLPPVPLAWQGGCLVAQDFADLIGHLPQDIIQNLFRGGIGISLRRLDGQPFLCRECP